MQSREVRRVSQLGKEGFDPGKREDRAVCESIVTTSLVVPVLLALRCVFVGDREMIVDL